MQAPCLASWTRSPGATLGGVGSGSRNEPLGDDVTWSSHNGGYRRGEFFMLRARSGLPVKARRAPSDPERDECEVGRPPDVLEEKSLSQHFTSQWLILQGSDRWSSEQNGVRQLPFGCGARPARASLLAASSLPAWSQCRAHFYFLPFVGIAAAYDCGESNARLRRSTTHILSLAFFG